MRDTVVLANASAGGRRGGFGRLERLCAEAGVELIKTGSPEDTRQRAREAARAGCRRVIAAGGDGTAHWVLNGIFGTEAALGVIPLGSANDIARGFGLPLQLEPALRTALTGLVRRADLGRVGEFVFASVATFGLGAAANCLANELHLHGRFLYSYALFRSLLAFRPPVATVMTGSERLCGRMMLGLVGNASSYGGGMLVTPHARIDDGLLDVCLVGDMSRWKLACYFPQVFFGAHLKHREVSYFRAPRLRVEADRPLDIFADGEYVAQTPAEFEAVPSGLNVVGR
jgi:diacylglycerol kinase (ATP)